MATVSTISTMMTIREAARRLGVHENTVRRYADRGLVRAVRLPSGVRRVHRADVERLQSGPAQRKPASDASAINRPATTVDELIAELQAKPVDDVAKLARPDLWDTDEDVERFIALTLAERARDR
jgi:excisionase family DNA binding protein